MINGLEILCFLCVIIGFIVSRIIYLLLISTRKHAYTKRVTPVKTIICIGSGGHTTEMIKLIENMNPERYKPRYYILAKTDHVSEEKVLNLEKQIYNDVDYSILKIPRSRVVNQSYITSVFTTIYSILYCVPVIFNIKPDLILTNGPGTCIPICLLAFLLKIFYLCDTKIIFIESICRVESLSLSGKILNVFADKIIVQWEELKKCYSKADYLGQLY